MDRPFVGVDNRRGASLGVSHLIACGHASVRLLAGFDHLSTIRERVAGYQETVLGAGLPRRDDWIVYSSLSIEEGRRAMRQLMRTSPRPRAVFINNNLLALGGLLELRALGLRCPQDVAVAAFDDHPWAAIADPPLTVVRQPAQELGRIAAQTLLALIRDQPVDARRVTLDCELVVRQSCGAACGPRP